MTVAVCVRCGVTKFGALTPCKECRQTPETEQEVIYSMALSDHFLEFAKLNEIARSIKNGQDIHLTTEQEDLLRPAAREYLKTFAPMLANAKPETSSRGEQIAQKVGDRNNPGPNSKIRNLADRKDPSSMNDKILGGSD